MRTALKVGGFALGLAAVFGVAVGVGSVVAPASAGASTSTPTPDGHAAMGGTEAAPGGAPSLPGGLLVSEDGYTLTLAEPSVAPGAQVPLRFRILGPEGDPVSGYRTEHDKDLHLIVVRRDLAHFQHVHPDLDATGTWSVPVDLPAAGDYRVFADFTPAGQDGGLVLGVDLAVPGGYQPAPLPGPADVAQLADGYQVTLAGGLVPGRPSELTLTVSKDGVPVTDLQPYLAAYGHLVALRAGDLAYLHVHPAGEPGDGVTPAGPGITFDATAPSAGNYRLFLNFRHAGVVRTAEFTVWAGPAQTSAPAAAGTGATSVPTAVAPPMPGHDDGESGGHGH